MRFTLAAITALAASLIAAHAVAQTRPHLCGAGEEAVFSCAVSGNKIVSLCAPKAPSAEGTALRYLFGARGKIERSYPAPGVSSRDAFSRGVTGGTGGGADFLRFTKDGAIYTLFSDHYRGRERDGLVVERGGKRISVLICRGNAIDVAKGWTPIYRANLRVDPPDFETP